MRFVYRPLIEPESDILKSHMTTRLHKLFIEWVNMNELLESVITQLAHSTVTIIRTGWSFHNKYKHNKKKHAIYYLLLEFLRSVAVLDQF